jgi:hypothetical protein
MIRENTRIMYLLEAECREIPDLSCLCDRETFLVVLRVYERWGMRGVSYVARKAAKCCNPRPPQPQPQPNPLPPNPLPLPDPIPPNPNPNPNPNPKPPTPVLPPPKHVVTCELPPILEV